jgi:hypothetical protein
MARVSSVSTLFLVIYYYQLLLDVVDPPHTLISPFSKQSYWVEKSPFLDNRWNGFFFGTGCHLTFMGTKEEAEASTFLNEFDEWYNNVLDKSFFGVSWGALPPSFTLASYDSWYDFKGGTGASGNPDPTDPTVDAYSVIQNQAARLMPRDQVISRPEEVADLLFQIFVKGGLGFVNYYLGGQVNEIEPNATAVNPAMRKVSGFFHQVARYPGNK